LFTLNIPFFVGTCIKLKSNNKKSSINNHTHYGGMAKLILLDDISSSGKSTIAKFYEKIGYIHIAGDDISSKEKQMAVFKTITE